MKNLLLKRKKAFALYVFACFLPVIGELANTYAIALLIGCIEIGKIPYFYQCTLIAVFIGIGSIILFMISRFLRIGFMRDTILDVRVNAFEKIMNLSYEDFNTKSKDVYISNIINDVNTFEKNFFLKFLNIIFQTVKYVIAISILLYLDFVFGFATLVSSIVLYIIGTRFEKKTIKMQNDVSDNNEQFTVSISNTCNGLEIIKLNKVEKKFLAKTLESINHIERKKLSFSVFTDIQRSITGFLSNLLFVAMMIYLLYAGLNGLSITSLTFMLQLAAGCVIPIGMVIPMFNELKGSISIYKKITTCVGAQHNLHAKLSPYSFKNQIELKKVSLKYDDKIILQDVSLTIKKGKKYLIKGASGSGKSSLLKILSKMTESYSGDIEIDGISYKHIDNKSFNENISFVYQDVFLFEDSIANNITLFKDYTNIEIERASKLSGMSDFIDSNKDGFNTMLMENGKNLSGGQRQRISIARAIFKKSDILFIDEGTASLNDEIAKAIENTILNLDNTVVAISHRDYPEIYEEYDYVIEINNGQIDEYDAKEYYKGLAI